mgnify:CR=1 FL=1
MARAASVCAGAVALAQAGLLDGRRATTHHDLLPAFAARFPWVRVVEDVDPDSLLELVFAAPEGCSGDIVVDFGFVEF